ncbi:hypothetical protein ABIF26_006409 [Bradyrhizobium elkanii]|uniref:hypothetical protein n=1 Tax=Bradyrhizobium elkanii TaxID=29448 RepID=UPI002168AAF4|nr:hypothetical protein [Bradyrhizobium elkanii]MCS3690906.1 hypothetical protein [Bradyrhizobium elkanii]
MRPTVIRVGDHADEPVQEPNFYTGTSFAVSEIVLCAADMQAKIINLAQGNKTGSAVQQKLAAEDISKIAGQIKAMADTISRVTIAHLNRRPRA